MTSHTPERSGVFISYSHRDIEWLERLRVHLKPLERELDIAVWDDSRIDPGMIWTEQIEKALQSAKVAVLLMTADFLASDFIATNELPRLLRAAEGDGLIILIVVIKASRFSDMESLSRFQTVNDPARPLITMGEGEREAVLVRVVGAVKNSLRAPANAKRVSTIVSSGKPFVRKRRRVDASVPSHASLNEHLDLLVQVRLPGTPRLGLADWPTKHRPTSIEQTFAKTALDFPIDPLTGRARSVRLEIRVVAPDFEIRGAAAKFLDVPPNGSSEIATFLITAQKIGTCKVYVEIYRSDQTYLGTIPLETSVDGIISGDAPSVANLVLKIVVEQKIGTPGSHMYLPNSEQAVAVTSEASPPSSRVSFAARKPAITAALTVMLFALTSGYWLFINKPALSGSEEFQYMGRIIDAGTKQPLSGAKVQIASTDTPQVSYTDSEGVFNIRLRSSNEVIRIRVEANGYSKFEHDIRLDRTVMQDILLVNLPGTPTPTPTPRYSPTPHPPTPSPPAQTPSWELISKWVTASYPTGTVIDHIEKVDSDCGKGCRTVKVALQNSARQTSYENVSVTYWQVNGRWQWRVRKN